MYKYNPEIHKRRSIRLKNYDYSREGLYFITICCKNREHLFGEIVDGKMILNDIGEMAQICWNAIPEHFENVSLHSFVIMPNHVHGIIERSNKMQPREAGIFISIIHFRNLQINNKTHKQ